MKRRNFIKKTSAVGLITIISPSDIVQTFEKNNDLSLEENFRVPPVSAYPQTFWFWMNGNVTKQGITLDMEAMKRVGIGGVFNFDAGTGIPKGPIVYLSEEWLQLKRHAMQEAKRLGLEFTMHNCPGWSASGGPWITPELAMQQITWSETYVRGGNQINKFLPKPPNRLNYYRDIAALAFPSMEGEDLLQMIRLSSATGSIDKKNLKDKDQQAIIVHPSSDSQTAWLQFEFNEPYEARQITFYISAIAADTTINKPIEFGERTSVALEASDDGIQFRLITTINTGLDTELLLGDKFITYDFPATKAKYFRLSSDKARRYRQVQFSGITRLKNWMEKTNHRARYNMLVNETSTIHQNNDQIVTEGSIIDANNIIDLSLHIDKDGMLNWNVPPGNWTILRIGFTPTGTYIRAAPDTGLGLECDKYNAAAMSFHFSKMTENLLPVMKLLAANKKMGLEIDSYEAGTQNWTHGFEQLFKKRWGYDIIKYLPALAGGRIVSSVNITERFLWDVRWLQASLIAENYYGRFQRLCHQHNITAYIEPYEMGPMEEMQIGSKADVNIGEFWNGFPSTLPVKQPARRTVKLAACIAHINDQKVVGAEAFTSEPESARWQEYPFALKAVGDKAFTKGVNRMIIHRYAHQPHSSALPGMTMGPWGIHFDRTNTWWNQSKGWLNYLSRCQYLLQQGRFVADLIYFTGEDANMYTSVNPDELNPAPPDGYDYDLINAEVIFKKVKIVDNQLVLPNGMSYRIFVLQNYKAVSLALLQKLRELLKEGMILVGAKPERSTGLADYTDSDTSFIRIANQLWGDINGSTITENSFGKGRIFWGPSLSSILQSLNIRKDFEFTSRSGDAPIIYIHRKFEEQDIYFLSNQRRTYEDIVCVFRVSNKKPELWNAVTGRIVQAGIYEFVDGGIRMPIQFEPYGSIFVVFRPASSSSKVHSVEKDDETVLSTKNFPSSSRHLYDNITNNFTISFWAKPEINVLLNPFFVLGTIREPWTEYYAIYPAPGKDLYEEGHATCGITVGRNGVAVWEHASGNPVLVLAAPTAISGWSHITLVYLDGIPVVYVNGKQIQKGKKSINIVHPHSDKAYLNEGASYYNGDMTQPMLIAESLSDDRISELATEKPKLQVSPFVVEMAGISKPALLIKKNGKYVLRNSGGTTSSFNVTDIDKPFQITGPWLVSFPPNSGAPSQIVLPELISLHKHKTDAVKYFSGTAVYTNSFTLSNKLLSGKHWLLNLGRVEVIAEVNVNGKDFDILWKRPYNIYITDALKEGKNRLKIKVTTLWPNRLIGDEQLPEPDKFSPGGGSSGIESITKGSIEQLPDWYIQGKPKPVNERVTFTTWKHFRKDSPLLESGLIGPVVLQAAVIRSL